MVGDGVVTTTPPHPPEGILWKSKENCYIVVVMWWCGPVIPHHIHLRKSFKDLEKIDILMVWWCDGVALWSYVAVVGNGVVTTTPPHHHCTTTSTTKAPQYHTNTPSLHHTTTSQHTTAHHHTIPPHPPEGILNLEF